jgi:hypothetical protein
MVLYFYLRKETSLTGKIGVNGILSALVAWGFTLGIARLDSPLTEKLIWIFIALWAISGLHIIGQELHNISKKMK